MAADFLFTLISMLMARRYSWMAQAHSLAHVELKKIIQETTVAKNANRTMVFDLYISSLLIYQKTLLTSNFQTYVVIDPCFRVCPSIQYLVTHLNINHFGQLNAIHLSFHETLERELHKVEPEPIIKLISNSGGCCKAPELISFIAFSIIFFFFHLFLLLTLLPKHKTNHQVLLGNFFSLWRLQGLVYLFLRLNCKRLILLDKNSHLKSHHHIQNSHNFYYFLYHTFPPHSYWTLLIFYNTIKVLQFPPTNLSIFLQISQLSRSAYCFYSAFVHSLSDTSLQVYHITMNHVHQFFCYYMFNDRELIHAIEGVGCIGYCEDMQLGERALERRMLGANSIEFFIEHIFSIFFPLIIQGYSQIYQFSRAGRQIFWINQFAP